MRPAKVPRVAFEEEQAYAERPEVLRLAEAAVVHDAIAGARGAALRFVLDSPAGDDDEEEAEEEFYGGDYGDSEDEADFYDDDDDGSGGYYDEDEEDDEDEEEDDGACFEDNTEVGDRYSGANWKQPREMAENEDGDYRPYTQGSLKVSHREMPTGFMLASEHPWLQSIDVDHRRYALEVLQNLIKAGLTPPSKEELNSLSANGLESPGDYGVNAFKVIAGPAVEHLRQLVNTWVQQEGHLPFSAAEWLRVLGLLSDQFARWRLSEAQKLLEPRAALAKKYLTPRALFPSEDALATFEKLVSEPSSQLFETPHCIASLRAFRCWDARSGDKYVDTLSSSGLGFLLRVRTRGLWDDLSSGVRALLGQGDIRDAAPAGAAAGAGATSPARFLPPPTLKIVAIDAGYAHGLPLSAVQAPAFIVWNRNKEGHGFGIHALHNDPTRPKPPRSSHFNVEVFNTYREDMWSESTGHEQPDQAALLERALDAASSTASRIVERFLHTDCGYGRRDEERVASAGASRLRCQDRPAGIMLRSKRLPHAAVGLVHPATGDKHVAACNDEASVVQIAFSGPGKLEHAATMLMEPRYFPDADQQETLFLPTAAGDYEHNTRLSASHRAMLQEAVSAVCIPLTCAQRTGDWFMFRWFCITPSIASLFATSRKKTANWSALATLWWAGVDACYSPSFMRADETGLTAASTDAVRETGLFDCVALVGLLAMKDKPWVVGSPDFLATRIVEGRPQLWPGFFLVDERLAFAETAQEVLVDIPPVHGTTNVWQVTWNDAVFEETVPQEYRMQVLHNVFLLGTDRACFIAPQGTPISIAYILLITIPADVLQQHAGLLARIEPHVSWAHQVPLNEPVIAELPRFLQDEYRAHYYHRMGLWHELQRRGLPFVPFGNIHAAAWHLAELYLPSSAPVLSLFVPCIEDPKRQMDKHHIWRLLSGLLLNTALAMAMLAAVTTSKDESEFGDLSEDSCKRPVLHPSFFSQFAESGVGNTLYLLAVQLTAYHGPEEVPKHPKAQPPKLPGPAQGGAAAPAPAVPKKTPARRGKK